MTLTCLWRRNPKIETKSLNQMLFILNQLYKKLKKKFHRNQVILIKRFVHQKDCLLMNIFYLSSAVNIIGKIIGNIKGTIMGVHFFYF